MISGGHGPHARLPYLGSNFPLTVKGWAEVAATIKQQNAASKAPRQNCMSSDVGSSVRYELALAICTCIKAPPKTHRACRGGAPALVHTCLHASKWQRYVRTACGSSTGMPLPRTRLFFSNRAWSGLDPFSKQALLSA